MTYVEKIMRDLSYTFIRKMLKEKIREVNRQVVADGTTDLGSRATRVYNSMKKWDFDSDSLSNFRKNEEEFERIIKLLREKESKDQEYLALLGAAVEHCNELEYWEKQVKKQFCSEWNENLLDPDHFEEYGAGMLLSAIPGYLRKDRIISTSLYRPRDDIFGNHSVGVMYKLTPDVLYAVSIKDANTAYNCYKCDCQELTSVDDAWALCDDNGTISSTYSAMDEFYHYSEFCDKIQRDFKAYTVQSNGEILLSGEAKPIGVFVHDYHQVDELKIAIGVALTNKIPIFEDNCCKYAKTEAETLLCATKYLTR